MALRDREVASGHLALSKRMIHAYGRTRVAGGRREREREKERDRERQRKT